MNIEFEKISFQNFLSFGDSPTEINLSNFKTTLVTGSNFSGKSSSILDTITFALFGKAFRNINKPQLINVYNNKNCLVELTFYKNNVKYKIRRGLKPNLFEIYRDDEQLDILSSAKDQQAEFEKTILNFTFQTFQQIVVLGSANYIPFMKLKPNDRRFVVDDILNLHVFTKMNDRLKLQSSETKAAIQTTENEIYLKEELLKTKEEHLEALSNVGVSIVDEEKVNSLLSQNIDLEKELEEKQIRVSEIVIEERKNVLDVDSQIKKAEKVKSKIMYAVETQKKNYDFFQDNSHCPTCLQEIEETFRTEKINDLKEKMLSKKSGVQELIEKIQKYKFEKDEIEHHNSDVDLAEKQVRSLNREIENVKEKITSNIEKISYLRNPSSMDTTKIEKTENEISDIKKDLTFLKNKLESYHEDSELQKNCAFLLRDAGIKATIMNKYLNLLNKNMEVHLKRFGLKLNFELDSTFNEKITNFSGHEFSYFSLSEGEKLRVDLSMMLSWRTLALKRAKMKTNLLILDEVMDGAADSHLQHELVHLLNDLKDTNVFVISHRADGLLEKFERNIHVRKNIGFSHLDETII